jgi:AraC-like DNA-binding protein
MNCPYHSCLKRLYIESKALALISYSLAQLVPLAGNTRNNFALRADDKERILEARNILISNLGNPPSLLELARQVGTNKTTLNKGFRQLFGTSTFDYLRVYRLERAKALLETKRMNVTQAALDVGYSRQSCFTRAYKDHFGQNPKDHFSR